MEGLEPRQMLAITVDTLADELDGNYNAGDLSLREAIAMAADASHPGPDTIDFSPSLTATGPATITLTYDGADAGTAADELALTSDVTIAGPGSDLLTIDADDQSRVFSVGSGRTATISGLTITGGNNVSQGGGIYSYFANLTLDSVRVTDN
jgi:CSLREA domain-containing protein